MRTKFSLFLAAGLLAAAMTPSPPARAEGGGGPDEQRADWQTRLESAKVMQKQAAEAKAQAKSRLDTESRECFHKFQVTACQKEAKQRYVAAMKDVRRQDNEGKALERQVKKEERADKDARHAADASRRAGELPEREAATQEEREQSARQEQERLAGKEAKAEAGEKRRATETDRIRKKREKHDRMVAEKMEKARRRQAEEAM